MSLFSPSSAPRETEKRNLSPFAKLRNAIGSLFKRPESKVTPGQSQAISVQNINWADTPNVHSARYELATAQELSDGAIRERAEAYSQRRAELQRQAVESQAPVQSEMPTEDDRVVFEWRGSSFAPPAPATSERTATLTPAALYVADIPKAPRVPADMQQGPEAATSSQKNTIPCAPIVITPTLYGVGVPTFDSPGTMQQRFKSAERIGSRLRSTEFFPRYTPSADAFPPEGPPPEPYPVSPSFAPRTIYGVRNSITETVVRSMSNRSGTISMIRRKSMPLAA